MLVEECEIECWKHGSSFSLATGEPLTLPATLPVPTYPVYIDDDRRSTSTRRVRRRRERRMSVLEIEGLRAGVAGREILRGIDLAVASGEVHAVMGPNGSGKSTLSHVLMGRPGYEVLGGSVTLDGVDVLAPRAVAARGGRALPRAPVSDRGAGCEPRCDAHRGAAAPQGRDVERAARPGRGRGRSGSASTPGSSTGRSTSICRAARRSATRRCSSPCCSRRSRSSTSSTPASTSTPCAPCAAASRRPRATRTSACSRSRTTSGCSTSCRPIACTSW